MQFIFLFCLSITPTFIKHYNQISCYVRRYITKCIQIVLIRIAWLLFRGFWVGRGGGGVGEEEKATKADK